MVAEVDHHPERDDRPLPLPGLGRAKSTPPPRARRKNSPNGANRSARSTDAAKNEEVELHLGSPAKYFLIWFNKAAPSRDQEGRYQIEISDVKLID